MAIDPDIMMFLPDLLGPLPFVDEDDLNSMTPSLEDISFISSSPDGTMTPDSPNSSVLGNFVDDLSFNHLPPLNTGDHDDDDEIGGDPGFYFNDLGEIVPSTGDSHLGSQSDVGGDGDNDSPLDNRIEDSEQLIPTTVKKRRFKPIKFDPENVLSNDVLDDNDQNYILNMESAKRRKILGKRPKMELNFAKVCLQVIGEPFSKILVRDHELAINFNKLDDNLPVTIADADPLNDSSSGNDNMLMALDNNGRESRISRTSSIEVGRTGRGRGRLSRLSSFASSITFRTNRQSSTGVAGEYDEDNLNTDFFLGGDFDEFQSFHAPSDGDNHSESNTILSVDLEALDLADHLKQFIGSNQTSTFSEVFSEYSRQAAAISFSRVLWLANSGYIKLIQTSYPGDIYVKFT